MKPTEALAKSQKESLIFPNTLIIIKVSVRNGPYIFVSKQLMLTIIPYKEKTLENYHARHEVLPKKQASEKKRQIDLPVS